MALSDVTTLSSSAFKASLYQFMKPRENDPLYSGTAAGKVESRIHDDGKDIPTYGYGFNLNSHSITTIKNAILYGFNKSYSDLSADQKRALQLITDYKAGTLSAKTLIDISMGASGSAADQKALKSLELDDAKATRIFDFMVFKEAGNFTNAYDEGLSKHLANSWDPPYSLERVALLDAFYNGPGLIGPITRNALLNDQREVVWFQLRYGTVFTDGGTVLGGLVKRRVDETDLFRLYKFDGDTALEKLAKAKDALGYMFGGKSGSANNFDLVVQKDPTILKYKPNDGFRTEIQPLLDLIRSHHAMPSALHVVLVGDQQTNKNDVISAIAARDLKLAVGASNNAIFGEEGADTLSGSAALDLLVGGKGSDTMNGGVGNDRLLGDRELAAFLPDTKTIASVIPGSTTLPADLKILQQADGALKAGYPSVGFAADRLLGGANNDFLFGDAGNDDLDGGDGDDVLLGGIGNDTLKGGVGNDRLGGGAGADSLNGSVGNDIYLVGAGDTVTDASGKDTVMIRDNGSYTLNRIETIAAVNGATALNLTFSVLGEAATATIAGNAASNKISITNAQAAPTYKVYGGGGSDTFAFKGSPESYDGARLYFPDFAAGDRIDLSAYGIDGMYGPGTHFDPQNPTEGFYVVSGNARFIVDDEAIIADRYFGKDNDWMIVKWDGVETAELFCEFFGTIRGSDFIL